MLLTLTSEARVLNPKVCGVKPRWGCGGQNPPAKNKSLLKMSKK